MDLGLYPPLPRRKDFRIGILGSGFIVNECHLVAYRKAGFNPVAIASRNPAHARTVAQRHGIPKVHDSYEALLDDKSIDVLDIAVPPKAQLYLIEVACARKTVKGILAQKPLGTDYQQAVQAVEACQAAGITLAVNQNMRYDHSVRAAKTLLDTGALGEPVFATIDMRGIPHWMDWHKDLGWLTLRIISIHHLDTFRYWFGDPEGIYCSVRTDPRTTFRHRDGICTYILEYTDGLRCVGIDDTWTGPAKEGCPGDLYVRWRIEGQNGLAIGDVGWCKDPYTTPSTIRYAIKGQPHFQCPVWPESWFPDAFIGTMAQLLIALEDGVGPAISGRDNLKTMALVEAAYRSGALSRRVDLNEPGLQGESGRGAIAMFTLRAQQLLGLARQEAHRLHHRYVGTEHLLLGLLRLGSGNGFAALQRMGLEPSRAREEIERHVGQGPSGVPPSHVPYTPRVKRALTLAAKEAKRLGYTYVGTEHVLLGLLTEGDGIAAQVLKDLGVEADRTRQEVLKGPVSKPPPSPGFGSTPGDPTRET